MKALWIVTLLFLVSCTSSQVVGLKGFEHRQKDAYYQNSGVIQYFLSELPAWANTYPDGGCHRDVSIRYFNMKSLRESYRYTYSDSLQFQYLYNQLSFEKAKGSSHSELRPQDEELIFFETSNRIQSGFYPFKKPDFERVSLIWIDPLLGEGKILAALLNRSDVMQGHPVLISNCLSSEEIAAWLAKNKIENANFRVIPSEMFTAYDSESKLMASLQIDVEKLFNQNQKIFFFVPKSKNPESIQGKFTYKFY